MNNHFLSKTKIFSFLTISLITFTQTIYTSENNNFPEYEWLTKRSFVKRLSLTPKQVEEEKQRNKHLMAINDKLPSREQLSQTLQQNGLTDFNKKTNLINSVLGSPRNSRQIVRIIDSAVKKYYPNIYTLDEKRDQIKNILFLSIFNQETLQYLQEAGYIDLGN